MKRIAVVGLALVLVGVCSGCFRTVYRGDNLEYSAAFGQMDPSRETLVRHFEQERWNHYFLFGLVPTSEGDMGNIIGRVPAGCEVRDLTIRHEVTFLNALIWFLVGGIYNPMTTTVSGDIVRVGSAAVMAPAPVAR